MLSWCEVGLVMSNVVGGWSFKYRSSYPKWWSVGVGNNCTSFTRPARESEMVGHISENTKKLDTQLQHKCKGSFQIYFIPTGLF
jgi:hypothetical protein